MLLVIAAPSIGGVYTVATPNESQDTAYKINCFTGKIWLSKTYAKPKEAVPVCAGREPDR